MRIPTPIWRSDSSVAIVVGVARSRAISVISRMSRVASSPASARVDGTASTPWFRARPRAGPIRGTVRSRSPGHEPVWWPRYHRGRSGVTDTDGQPTSAVSRQTTGARPWIRADGAAKATGQARYTADLAFPGLAHARLLLAGRAHARIARLDTSRAHALPGV